MKHLVFVLFSFLFSVASLAAPCVTSNPFGVQALAAVSRSSCVETLKSRECQDLFAKMRAAGEKPEEKALQCHNQSSVSRAFEASWDYTSGCAVGGWNFVKDTFVLVGTSLGEGMAKIVMDHEAEVAANAACDADPKSKDDLLNQYNSSVPKLLQMKRPAADVMARTPCAEVKSLLKKHRLNYGYAASLQISRKYGMKDPKYTPDELEFINWGKSRAATPAPAKVDLVGMAKAKLKEMGVKLECYNSHEAAAMMCEAIAEVGTLAAGPAGAALKAAKAKNIMKIAGMGAEAEKTAVTARAVAGAVDLEKVARLSNGERVLAAEKSLGRSLSAAEKKALIDAHEVGRGTGRGYGTYSTTDLGEKANILKSAGFSASERDLIMRQGLAGSLSDTKAAKDFANMTRLKAEKLAGEGAVGEATTNYRKASDSYEVYMNDAKAMKSERDYWVGARLNSAAERYDKAAEYFIKTETMTSRTDERAMNIFNALRREKDELRVIAAKNPGNKAAQKAYDDHRKLIEAVTKSPSLQMGDPWKRELLKP